MEHYESCSQETIKNAVSIYKDMNIINIDKDSHSDEDMVRSIVDEIRVTNIYYYLSNINSQIIQYKIS